MSVEQETLGPNTAAGVDVPQRRRLPWGNILRIVGIFVVLTVFVGLYYKQSFTVLSDRNAADIAQVARNIATGEGYTTHLIRPFNAGLQAMSDSMISLPEVNHAPAYPYAVATAFRLRSPSDQVIVWVSLIFVILTIFATGVLGRLLFDWDTGLLAAATVGLSAYVLNVAASGAEWTMTAFLFALLLCAVTLHNNAVRQRRAFAGHAWVVACALLFGALYWTSFVMALLIVPLAVYFGVTGRAKRLHLAAFVILGLLLTGPLVYKNHKMTGSPILGVNAWEIMANTQAYPGDSFYRSANTQDNTFAKTILFPIERFPAFAQKLVRRSCDNAAALASGLGLLGLPFALVSVLYKFKPPQANAVRGLIYGILPVVLVCFGVFSVDTKAVIVLAPPIAIFGGAYLLLLLKSKNIHAVYTRMLVGAFVLITALPTIVVMAWGPAAQPSDKAIAADLFFADRMSGRGTLYTDVPWIAAWRTEATAVWLPRQDADVTLLAAHGFPLQAVVLTPECEGYSSDEFWPVLHRVRIWRKYVTDPQGAIKELIESAGVSSDKAAFAEKYVRRLKRHFAVSDSLTGFTLVRSDTLQPDDIQVLIKSE
ncbi:MAG: glycosyltransferase family 39 protein [Armatimonadetes bacterium]|nr:glycosyltransferase family 39 protein [Armatimonadota bacterium]